MYEIDAGDVTRVDSRLMTCEACCVYPLSYHFGVTVNVSEMHAMVDEGWVTLSRNAN